jgi:hypothetical protein
MLTRSAVRLDQFNQQTDKLARVYARASEIIDGAVWEISKNPEGLGTYDSEIDVWVARLEFPKVLLLYSINRRYICMLTIKPWD